MRVTIIADDSHVYVEEQALKVELTGLDEDIHAVQWYGVVGEIEYKYNAIENTRRPNERFTDFVSFQIFVDRWMVEAQKPDPVLATSPVTIIPAGPMHVIA